MTPRTAAPPAPLRVFPPSGGDRARGPAKPVPRRVLALVAVVLLAILVIPIILFQRNQQKQEEAGR